jgi:hypothetical protein
VTETPPDDDAPNEILAEVKAHARVAEQAVIEKTRNWPLSRIGFAAGIGSAAVAAAVLFTRRTGREKD